MGKPEGRVENRLVAAAKNRGYMCFKFVSPGKRGVPDRIVIAKGRTIFVETKAPNGQLSAIQKHVIKQMRAAGADVRVAWSVEAVDNLINELDKLET